MNELSNCNKAGSRQHILIFWKSIRKMDYGDCASMSLYSYGRSSVNVIINGSKQLLSQTNLG